MWKRMRERTGAVDSPDPDQAHLTPNGRPAQDRQVQVGTALALMAICISVFTVWIPAHLQISAEFVIFNNVWDRIEKALILILDVGLNIYFLWLVKSTLIDYELTKYTILLRFNLAAIFLSVSLDVHALPANGKTWSSSTSIEMNLADLICRIVLDPGKRSRPPNNAIANQPPSDYFGD
ncbi:hypothetical protein MAPG_01702 [Magnaporthiopsis poae ATCC 64411]|uniref:Integral membrane protein n=1 Tax=Magnaporthiopsis poae (strain ATCC 64411 / 73-15) TaxID=644358 RepID=A0A0C4DPD8_MAGP6|nr:hypothetical protein MAPG_01702 [Magnaporthiopsis poae ATCC 64411]